MRLLFLPIFLNLAWFSSFAIASGTLFEESFDSADDFSAWYISTGSGDNRESPQWYWSEDQGIQHSGAAQIYSVKDSYGYSCLTSEKYLISPLIEVGDADEVMVVFSMGYQGPSSASNKMAFVYYDGGLQTEMQEFSLSDELHILSKDASWSTYGFTIHRGSNATRYDQMQIGFRYLSSDDAECEDIYTIDNLTFRTNAPPETIITRPVLARSEVRLGETIQFLGSASDPDGDQITYNWRFCNQGDDCRVQGKEQYYTFDEHGVYEIVCWATDSKGNSDPTPARRWIRVVNNIKPYFVSATVRDQNGQTVQFRDGFAMIPAGTTLTFQADARDRDSQQPVQYQWLRYPEADSTTGVSSVTFEYPEPGSQVVACVIKDQEGAKSYRLWKLLVLSEGQNVPPMARIVSPANYAQIFLGQTFNICGEVIDPDTDFDSCFMGPEQKMPADQFSDGVGRVFWSLNDGQVFEGIGASDVSIYREGNYKLAMMATDGEFSDRKSVQFSVIDLKNLEPPSIIQPAQTIRIQPGQEVFFEGTVRSSSILKKYFFWTVKSLSTGGSVEMIRTTTLSSYVFNEPGHYEVTLTAVHPLNDSLSRSSEKREIWVEEIPEISGNTGFDSAASIPLGRFTEGQVTSARFFRIQLRERGQNLRLHVEYDGTADISIFNINRELVGSQRFSGVSAFQLRSLPAGTYYIKIDPVSAGKTGLGKDLTFGMGVDVVNAGLYFPDIELNANYDTTIGLLNPFNEEINVELMAYDKFGGLLEQVPVRISAMGRYSSSVRAVFPLSFQNISWIRADASGMLSGYSLVKSNDGLESYAMHAAEKLSKDLYVPHIAQRTDQWYTVAHVVNGSPDVSVSSIVAGQESKSLNNKQKFSKDDFNMLDKFGGSVPAAGWGTFVEESSEIRLAGAEIFGKLDGNRQAAGLLLDDNGHDNPNFTYVRNDLYFTHIARSVNQFWTGLAFVNTLNHTATFKLIAYGDGGSKIGERNFTLAAGEKVVDVAENLLQGVGSPANVDWVKVEADSGIVGYELFGTHDNRRLAGLEGIRGLKNEICFPYLDVTGETWHGISVVNVSEASSNLTFRLMSDSGDVLQEVHRSLNGNQKIVLLVSDLFGLQQLPANAGWVSCKGDQLLAGFELFGDHAGDSMAAVIAR